MHCCSKLACGLPFFGGTSLVGESGCCGLNVLPLLVVTVVPGAMVVVGTVVDVAEGTGEVTAGIETAWVEVSPELSLPHPVTISPMASATGMSSP